MGREQVQEHPTARIAASVRTVAGAAADRNQAPAAPGTGQRHSSNVVPVLRPGEPLETLAAWPAGAQRSQS